MKVFGDFLLSCPSGGRYARRRWDRGFCHGLEVKMLVITRREGEEVVIGDPNNPIGVVRIASIKGDRVRIAFDFPRAIDVHRREVANQIIAAGDAPAGAPSHPTPTDLDPSAAPNCHPPAQVTIVVAPAPVTK